MKITDYKRLLEAAHAAMRFSYAPYSKFRVGAAVLTQTGNIITGSNIENAAYGPTICAERVAIFNAVSQGELHILALAIVGSSGSTCPPCGTCRQVIYELARNAEIILEDSDGSFVVKRITDLLPMPFGPEHL